MFDEANDDYAPVRERLRDMLTADEYASARQTVTTAFYTPPQLTQAIWQGLDATGFSGGDVLEPGVGTGGFIDSAPEGTRVVGVERDPLGALIAHARFPDATIRREDFADTKTEDGTFTATVGNVPFSPVVPYDPAHNRANLSTHNYFISKSTDLTAPGGYVAVVTSQHTADSAGRGDTPVQTMLTDRADFITGVRLPGGRNGAFADFAGTEVGTDVLIFRKRADGEEPTERTEQFRRKASVTVGETSKTVNAFFAEHPDHVLGQWQEVSGRYGREVAVRRDDEAADLGERVRDILVADAAQAREAGYGCTALPAASRAAAAGFIEEQRDTTHTTIGTLRYQRLEDGSVTFEQFGVGQHWREVKCAKKYQQEWADIINMRDTAVAVVEACRRGDEQVLPALRAQLNEQYDAYVDRYGALNRFTIQPPRAKSESRQQADFDKAVERWRKANGVGDRPWEGELPEEVTAQLWEEASQPATTETRKQLHLRGAIKTDPYVIELLAFEDYDAETRTPSKGPMFSTNPLRSVEVPTSADNVDDAVVIARTHGMDMTAETFAGLVGRPVDDVVAEMESQGIAFRHPHRPDEWIPASDYLTGSLRPKLRAAREAAADDARFSTNVSHLEQAMPEQVTEVAFSLGATWIPTADYHDFICEVLNIPDHQRDEVGVTYTGDHWYISAPDDWTGQFDADLRYGVRASNADGDYNYTDRRFGRFSHCGIAHRSNNATVYSALQAVTDVMNMTAPRLNMSQQLHDTLHKDKEGKKPGVHVGASAFAATKADAVSRAFTTWAAKDADRWERLIASYNRLYNSTVPPTYDGSRRQIEGLSDRFDPYPYQLNAVERMLNEPGVLLNHVVGAGKTGSMVMGATQLKQLGVARQPWMVVPNHLLDQIAIEAKQWMPGARVLVESTDGASRKDDRQRLLSQASSGDWDLVLVSASSFAQMSMSADYMEKYAEEKLKEFNDEIDELSRLPRSERMGQTVKDLEASRERFVAKTRKTLDAIRRDDTITWDQTQADYLIVDEAHNYKNLRRISASSDLNEEGSDKAADMEMKLRYLNEIKGEHHPTVTFATGTPIANNIAELYTMMEYLRPDLLREAKLGGVTAWGHNFTEQVSSIGLSAGNQIRTEHRIGSYQNLAELTRMAAPMFDTVTREDIPRELPKIKGGETTVVTFDIDQDSKDFIQDLGWREKYKPDNPKIDNALKIMSDGQKATLAPQLVGLEGEPGVGRVHVVAENILREWRENRDNVYLDQRGEESPHRGGLQIVFCDRSVPKKDGSFSVYDALRNELVEAGMDKDRIRFIHEWDAKRTQLFDDCNNGQVDVLIANTPKLGTGANVQARAVAIHHVDVPWRPADLEQQDGRVFRQGNQNAEVARYTYIARGTYDGHSWNTLERKARFIDQFTSADYTMRTADPLEDGGMDAMAQNKAIATGNPDFLTQAELRSTVDKLQAEADEFTALAVSRTSARSKAQRTIDSAERTRGRLEGLVGTAEQWAATPLDKRTWSFADSNQGTRDQAVEAMGSAFRQIMRARDREAQPIGSIGGVPFRARYSAQDGIPQVSTPYGTINTDDFEKWVFDPTYAHSGVTKEEIASKQRGLLSRMENFVRSVPGRIDRLDDEIAQARKKIEDIDAAAEIGEFPKQAQLDAAVRELQEVDDRLAQFDSSAAQRALQEEHLRRLAQKGWTQGFSLALNPTRYMVDSEMHAHPASPQRLPGARRQTGHGLTDELGLNGLGPGYGQSNGHDSGDDDHNGHDSGDDDHNGDDNGMQR